MSINETVIDFASAIEAACVKLKHDLGASQEQIKWTWDPGKIAWIDEPGHDKGPFQSSEDINNLEFKRMLIDLNQHKDTLERDGLFYWVYRNGAKVGRIRRRT